MTNHRFRPVERGQRVFGTLAANQSYDISSFQLRITPYHTWAKRPLNEVFLGKLSGILHHRLGHGTATVHHRFKSANMRFEKRKPVRRVSTRYWNKFSIEKFL
jgi:hypothetical protein